LFQGKPTDARKAAKKGGDRQMAYLTATVESLVKKGLNSLSAKSVLAGEKLVATYSIST
jgi:hypothetical protein